MSQLDRLSSLICHFEVTARIPDHDGEANLFITGSADELTHLRLYLKAESAATIPDDTYVMIKLDWGGEANPLFQALPDYLEVDLHDDPQIEAVARLIASEVMTKRCGGQYALSRLSELLLVSMLRFRIENNDMEPGLFAGLAHPKLSPVMVAIHDEPGHAWNVDDLTQLSGMSRSQFMTEFQTVVGKTPIAYLKQWRMVLARIALKKGERVNEVARRFGYGSGDAFCRAFVAIYGVAPSKLAAN